MHTHTYTGLFACISRTHTFVAPPPENCRHKTQHKTACPVQIISSCLLSCHVHLGNTWEPSSLTSLSTTCVSPPSMAAPTCPYIHTHPFSATPTPASLSTCACALRATPTFALPRHTCLPACHALHVLPHTHHTTAFSRTLFTTTLLPHLPPACCCTHTRMPTPLHTCISF